MDGGGTDRSRRGGGAGGDEKGEWAGEELKIKGKENNQEMKRVQKRVDLQSRTGKVKTRQEKPSWTH